MSILSQGLHWLMEPYQYDESRTLLIATFITILVAYIMFGRSSGRLQYVSPSIIATFSVHYGHWFLWMAFSSGVRHDVTSYFLLLAAWSIFFPGMLILLAALLLNMAESALKKRFVPEFAMLFIAILGHVFAVHASVDPNEL